MKAKGTTPKFNGDRLTPRAAIPKHCRWCNGGSATTCASPSCSLFTLRSSQAVPEAKVSPLRAIRARCLDCVGSAEAVRTCTAYKPILSQPECPLWPHREGKRNVSPEYRAERRAQALKQREKAGAAPVFLSLLPFSKEKEE